MKGEKNKQMLKKDQW